MNRLLPFLISLFAFLGMSYPSAFAQRDFLGMPKVSVGDEEFFLRWSSKTRQGRLLEEFLPEKMDMTNFEQKLDRLMKFYIDGLGVVGWNKYSSISVAFSNQVVCKKK